MRFSTLCLVVAVAMISVSLDTSSDAGDTPKQEVKEVSEVATPLFQRKRTRTVNVEVEETPAPVVEQCGPNGCNIVRNRVTERVSSVMSRPRERGGLFSRLFNRNSRRSVSVTRGCCR